jgi:hypothetical protein
MRRVAAAVGECEVSSSTTVVAAAETSSISRTKTRRSAGGITRSAVQTT